MSNPSGRKGAYWEHRLASYLACELGLPVERRVTNGAKDRGDLTGIPFVVVEAKNEKRIDLPGYLREAERERANDGAKLGVVMVPYAHHGVGDGYAVVRISDMAHILRVLVKGEAW